MDSLTKTIQNNVLAVFGTKAPENVLNAIKKASAATGVNFAYMLQQAGVESSFNPEAKAKSSSASGLYQFISSTWMDMMNKYGEKHGVDTDGMSKKEILALRSDPEISANMAAEFASENERYLNKTWGGDVGSTELYLAHFMGAGGAAAFLKARDQNPLQPAANLMPSAAKANRNVFYDPSGRPKTIDEVYARFDKKFQMKDIDLPALDENTQSEWIAEAQQAGEALAAGHIASFDSTNVESASIDENEIVQTSLLVQSLQGRAQRSRFSMAQNSFVSQALSSKTAQEAAMPAAYNSLVRSPVDVMLLTQLSAPGLSDKSKTLF